MSAIQRILLTAAALSGVLALAGLAIGLFGIGTSVPVVAQFTNLGQGPPGADPIVIDGPNKDFFCAGDKCAGKTCDEVNDVCVGTVTLQPAMGQPLVGLSVGQFDRFTKGKESFGTVFTADVGLGPVFNKDSCGGCHANPQGGSGSITVTRFGKIDVDSGGQLVFDPLAELGGSLLNSSAISPACAEHIPVPPTNVAANRLTNSTLGFGLVEAVPDSDIEMNAIAPPLGVSGRVHYVPQLESPGVTRVGRFGWKSQLATVLSFSADASLQEMGLTTRILQHDNAPNADEDLLASCDTVADPEDHADSDGVEFVDRVTDFQRFLAAPPQTPKSGMTGETLFNLIGCASCHMGTFHTKDSSSVEKPLRNKQIHPYSDFLLHDMGNNADFIEQGGAKLTELRTPPLWGLRVRDPMWHDGRVAGGTFKFRILQVVSQHNDSDSEALISAQAFNALLPAQKDQIVAFLNSLGRREFDMDSDGDVDSVDQTLAQACFTGPGSFFTADADCAIADPDQDGDVDQADLDLLNVALGVASPPTNDEDEDGGSNGDDENGGGKGKGNKGKEVMDDLAPVIDGGMPGGFQGIAFKDNAPPPPPQVTSGPATQPTKPVPHTTRPSAPAKGSTRQSARR
jgi:hypothetical protein